MKINFNSIVFKALFIILLSFGIFAIFLFSSAKDIFGEAYNNITHEKIDIIKNNISPSIALNLTYGFNEAIDEIVQETLENPHILFLKIQPKNNSHDLVYGNKDKTLEDFKKSKEFISYSKLVDPATNQTLGELTLVYSNKSYKQYMQSFYAWITIGMALLIISILFVSAYIYKSLKHLSTLENHLRKFDPLNPEFIKLDLKSKDEISSIASSANTMIHNIIDYIDYSNELNIEISKQQNHLKDAQRIAHAGSWEYNLSTKELILSDEIYRILGIRRDISISWEQFLGFISQKDSALILNVLDKAISNGSTFDVKYSLSLTNGKEIDIHTIGKVRKKALGDSKITSVSKDITEDTKNKKLIEKLAYFDSLTGLPNRTLLKDRTQKALQNAARVNEKVAMIFLDLDHFKLINDTLGHGTGDELLIYISKILSEHIRETDTLSRLGGDEFVILLPNIKELDDVRTIANKLLNALRGKHEIDSHHLFITTSIGISVYPDNSNNIDELITNADTAMYDAKKDGRNNYKLYTKSMSSHISRQMSLEQDLRAALKNGNELEIYYQPKIDTKRNSVEGAEALIRWNHPAEGLMYPDEFIGIAESTGMILEMGSWIISRVALQIETWSKAGLDNLKIAINLSPRQFQDKDLVPLISKMIKKYHISPSQLEFEVTETMSMSNIESTMRTLHDLKNIGVSIAIDDFGTGYSSLSYLKKFPINTLKIDKSFVMDMTIDSEDRTIVETIITMAHTLGFKTVAEGVETQEHKNMLKEMGCDLLQGYYYSKAIPEDEFIKFLNNYSSN